MLMLIITMLGLCICLKQLLLSIHPFSDGMCEALTQKVRTDSLLLTFCDLL